MRCRSADVASAVDAMVATALEHRAELSHLDREIGDGDHGENLGRGFLMVRAKLVSSTPATPGAVLKLVATTLISTVGGAAGPLYGSAFLRAAAVGDAESLDATAIADALAAALEAVRHRGKADLGDKTMVDALGPAAAAARSAAVDGEPIAVVLEVAAAAAEAGARATAPLIARKGRASYLGERSAGHVDPGARSTALLLRAVADNAARSL